MVMLRMIGLGLGEGEITVGGKKALSESEIAFAEFYTNTENIDVETLEHETGTHVEKLSREEVEQEQVPVEQAENRDVAFLVSGDPLIATTHYELKRQAEERGIDVEVFHAPSILTSVSETGLNAYKFGRTVTLPEDSSPASVSEFIEENDSIGLHTLVLLDIDYGAGGAAEKLIDMGLESKREAIVLSRANTDEQSIELTELGEAVETVFGRPPHSIILLGETSHKEEEFLEGYR